MERHSAVLLGTAATLVVGANVAIFIAPSFGAYVFLVAAPFAALLMLVERALHQRRR